MVGVLGLLLLLGSLPLRRPPGRFGGVLIRSAVRAAANSFAPSYRVKDADVKIQFYDTVGRGKKYCIRHVSHEIITVSIFHK